MTAFAGTGSRRPSRFEKLAATDEDGHVLAKPALVVEHIAARPLVHLEIGFEDAAHGGASNRQRGARQMTLDILDELTVGMPRNWPRRDHGRKVMLPPNHETARNDFEFSK